MNSFNIIETILNKVSPILPTKWEISDCHTGTICTNDNHRLDGTGSIAKTLDHMELIKLVDGYTHTPSGSSAFLGADKTRGYGTDVAAGAEYNIYQNKNFGADLTGHHGRHFGGPGGTGRPSSEVVLNAHEMFWAELDFGSF